jgi:hypothetical protein
VCRHGEGSDTTPDSERPKKDPCNYNELQGSAASTPHTPVVRKVVEIIDVRSRLPSNQRPAMANEVPDMFIGPFRMIASAPYVRTVKARGASLKGDVHEVRLPRCYRASGLDAGWQRSSRTGPGTAG